MDSSSSSSTPRPSAASPEPQCNAITNAGLALDAPDVKTQLFLVVLSGSATAVGDVMRPVGPQRSCELVAETYTHEGLEGNLIFFAAFYNNRPAVKEIMLQCGGPSKLEGLLSAVLLRLLQEKRFPMVLYVLSLSPVCASSIVDAKRGDTLLHTVCRIPKPPAYFLEKLFELMVEHSPPTAPQAAALRTSAVSVTSTTTTSDHKAMPRVVLQGINAVNAKGKTPLHVAAACVAGVEGKILVKLLLRHGADDSILTSDGRSVVEVCQNGYIRQVLAHSGGDHRRRLPPLDPEIKAAIDGCQTSAEFPDLPPIIEEPSTYDPLAEVPSRKADSTKKGDEEEEDDGKRKKGAPLSQEEQDDLVRRLHDQTLKSKEQWFAEEYRKIEEEDQKRYHSKKLAVDDVESSVARVYLESLEKHATKIGELNAKYIPERKPGPQLEKDDLDACSYRLSKGSQEKLAATHQELESRYAPKFERKKLSKDQMEASAQRLWKESLEKTQREHTKLFEEYCCREKGRFNGGRAALTKEEIKAMGDRLSKKN